MKYKIVCKYCNEDTIFENISEKPLICPHCGDPTEKLKIIELSFDENKSDEKKLEGLSLCCQNTGIDLHLKHNDRIVIGREMFDEKILGKKYITGSGNGNHCQIEFEDGNYKLSDLYSTNGTYLGVDRIDCKLHPKQIIKNGDILYLGKEPFLIKINTKFLVTSEESKQEIIKKEETLAKRYRCKRCGIVVIEKTKKCPECGCYENMENWEIVL